MSYNRGIYGYLDLNTQKIVYIGKDSHIDKESRRKSHKRPSQVDNQPFNRVLQNNINRYKYFEIANSVVDENELNFLEKIFIKLFDPKFNFTEGGDGALGYHHTKEARQRLSEINKGKTLSDETRKKISKNNARYWAHHKQSEEQIRKMAKTKTGRKLPEKTKKKMSENNARYWKGKTFSREHIENNARSRAKYTLWDILKTNYNKAIMFRNNKKGLLPRKCFYTRYRGKQVPLGVNYDFLTCEIISNLIKEECG